MIDAAKRAEIRRLYYAEHWKIGTIAEALGVHAETVRTAIESERFNGGRQLRPSVVDPYLAFVRETLATYPRLVGTRLLEMLKDRGYPGTIHPLRRVLTELRPRRRREAYLRMNVFPGEYAQVDWGHFGSVEIGRGKRNLSCFVMVLSHSRAMYALLTLDQTIESFLRGHVEAFAYFRGVARTLLYDNLKSVVLERVGDVVRFHPRILELAGHYHFAPKPCHVRAAWEKGVVERSIGYLRSSFFAARRFVDVADLNAQFARWREEVAHARKVPGNPRKTVAEALAEERPRLLPMPEKVFEVSHLRAAVADKTAHVRFDRNDYSVPPRVAGKPLTLVATTDLVRLLDGIEEVARHGRSWGTAETVDDPGHVEELLREKRGGRSLKGRDRLRTAVPEVDALYALLALRGANLGRETMRLLRLLDEYGAVALAEAVRDSASRGAAEASAVEILLDRRRRAAGLPPSVPNELPEHIRGRDVDIRPHRLEDYDALLDDDTNQD